MLKKLTGYTTIGKGNYFLVNLGLYWCIICVLKNLCHNTVNLQYKKLFIFIENILNKLFSLFNKRSWMCKLIEITVYHRMSFPA